MENTAEFPKSSRLLKREEYSSLKKGSSSITGNGFKIVFKKNNVVKPRLGLAVSSSIGNAVCRNKVKRLVRESFRVSKNLVKVDYLFIPRKGIKLVVLRASLERTFLKIKENINGI